MSDELDSAFDAAKLRGVFWKEHFRASPPDVQEDYIAGDIYEYLFGFQMGAYYFDELPAKNTGKDEGEYNEQRPHTQEAYRAAAHMIVRIMRDPNQPVVERFSLEQLDALEPALRDTYKTDPARWADRGEYIDWRMSQLSE
jgi:hypothetical protein